MMGKESHWGIGKNQKTAYQANIQKPGGDRQYFEDENRKQTVK
jgi:hypothetical protein